MKLFQYAVIWVPKKAKEGKSENKARIVVPVTNVLAADIQSATLLAARAIPENYIEKLDECEVSVRPF